MADPQQSLDFSSVGGVAVPAHNTATQPALDFSSVGGKPVAAPVMDDQRMALTRPDLVAPPPAASGLSPDQAMRNVINEGNQFMGAPSAPDWAVPNNNAVTDAVAGVAKGFVKSAGQTIAPGPRRAAQINTATGMNVPSTANPGLQTQGAAEGIGAGLEGIGEFILGDEALKSLPLLQRAEAALKAEKALKVAAGESPLVAKVVHAGINAIRTGAVGAVQGIAHGESAEDAAKTGTVAGVTGGVLDTAVEGVKALSPAVKEIAGEAIPVRGSQESNVAKAAESLAPTKTVQAFDVEQTQPAAKRAIGNVATEVKNAATETMTARDADAAIEKLRNASVKSKSLGEAADAVRNQSKPVFEKLDELTKNQDMTFSDLQQQERGAFRRGDIETAKKARAAQDQILNTFKDQFDAGDLDKARANWRQASALNEVHDTLNSKSVVGPTPVNLRPTGAADPGFINGKNFSKEILKLANEGTLQQAGLTPQHIQSLQDLGTLLEKSAVEHPDLLMRAFKAGKVIVGGPATAGSGYLVSAGLGKVLTNPKWAANTLKLAQALAKATPAATAQGLRTILDGARPILGNNQ